MKSALYISSSIQGEMSATTLVVQAVKSQLQSLHRDARHFVKDLDEHPLAHFRREHLATDSAGDHHLQKLKACDVLIIGAPMYNFGIPSTLKAWIDRVVRANETFEYTASGPRGLLSNKKVLLVVATGGDYTSAPLAKMDHVTPYLVTVLGFIGLTDVTVIQVSNQGIQSDKDAALSLALAKAVDWAKRV